MGSNDEGVPMLFQQPGRQGSQFYIPTPIRGGGDIGIGPCHSHDGDHIELIDPTLRPQLGGSFLSIIIQEGF